MTPDWLYPAIIILVIFLLSFLRGGINLERDHSAPEPPRRRRLLIKPPRKLNTLLLALVLLPWGIVCLAFASTFLVK